MHEMSVAKKQRQEADLSHAAPGAATPGKETERTANNADCENMYKLRNGKGDLLQTPKRTSIARAKALLTSPSRTSPNRLTVTGSGWPLASVVSFAVSHRL